MRRLAGVAVVLTLASVACTDDQPAVTAPPPTAPTEIPKADYALSGQDCGTTVLDRDQPMPQAGVDCLRTAAAAGAGAHLVLKAWTDEGDPFSRPTRLSVRRASRSCTTPGGTTSGRGS